MDGAGDPARTIAAGEFKNRCLALMDEVNETGQEILITKRGRPVSRLLPARKSVPIMWGRYKNVMRIVGDIISPVESPEAWDAIARPELVLDPPEELDG